MIGGMNMSTKYNIQEWQNHLCEQYITFRKKSNNCKASTERTIRATLYSFFDYVNTKGIEDISEIEAMDLKNWSIGLTHLKVRVRNLYVSQLRLFFEYLSEEKLVSPSLPIALLYHHAPLTSVVEILSEKQLQTINNYRIKASTAMELRDIAIVLLGLRMGIRGGDICKLKLTDVSWKDCTVSFEQEKTGVFVTLPLPTDVGNSLYQYITKGRPNNSKSEQIFLSHKPPYEGIKSKSTTIRSLKHIFSDEYIEMPKGFHITRRTFASKMLVAGNSVDIIATALGHSSIHNVSSYLSTDDRNLRLCAMSCNKIQYRGVFEL